jgi:5'/3'-nucleotidase
VSLNRPLRVSRLKEKWFMVDGTPTDCVVLAVRDLLGRRPALVASGINAGANLGDDVTYSGTVAGAFEGMLLRIPSFAISNVGKKPKHFEASAAVGASVAQYVLAHGLLEDTALNVNVPDLPLDQLRGTMFTRMGRRNYTDEIIKREDPRGGKYYWIGGADATHDAEDGDTDFAAIEKDCVSITPLQRDITHHAALSQLQSRPIETKLHQKE